MTKDEIGSGQTRQSQWMPGRKGSDHRRGRGVAGGEEVREEEREGGGGGRGRERSEKK